MKPLIISSLLSLLVVGQLYSQCTNPPSGVDCLCSTATILCTPDELDGFTFSMSSSTNFGGLPAFDLCPGIGNQDGVPNNVNWFAFIAWCTNLTLDITTTNCTGGPLPGGGMSFGAQVALFANCGNPWNPVDCITEGADACGNSATNYPSMQTINATGLTIGNVYYFMLDGCAGSACDVTITVPQVCGNGTIDPWTTGLTGPLTTCVGNTETYTAEDLDGAVEFYYTLDGNPLIDGTELTSISQTWNTAGTFQLCVDVGNDPCIPVTDDPSPFCIDVVVCDAAEAGTININTTPACPDETINFDVVGFTDTPDHDQYVLITTPSGEILEVNVGNTASYTSDMCESFKVFSYNLKAGAPAPTVGTFFPTDYPCLDSCCDSEEANFSFEDMMPPVFTAPPASTTLDCDALLDPIVDLDYTDNCIPDGSVAGTETGSSDPCAGGSITREWTITDMCDNTATHTQVITIDPLDPAVVLNPPADITVECTGIPTSATDLTYDNSLSGVCSIMGTLMPVYNDPADLCGGTNTFTWSTTDICGRPIEHIQTITVNPTPVATYINPPTDITFSCENKPTSFTDLDYSNGLSGSCEILGTVTPTIVDNATICGGTITVTWSDTDPCGRLIEYMQTITIDPAPVSMYDMLPANETIECDAIPTSYPDLSHTNGITGDCNISNTVTPTVMVNSDFCGGTITVSWNDTDFCNRAIDHQQIITVNPAPQAQFINTPPDITLDCDMAPSTAPDLMLTNMESGICLISSTEPAVLSGIVSPCGATLQFTWEYTDLCGRFSDHVQNVTINPAPGPQFDTPPADITVDCNNIPSTGISLNYTNGETGDCEISGTELSTRTGSFDACGGTLVDTWGVTDICGTVIVVSRSISVNPAPAPVFINPPVDITVECADVPSVISNINYSNNETGACAINGDVDAIISGGYTECGGQILQVYSYLDPCGRAISHTRTVIVNPAPDPVFIDPPADVLLDCDISYTPPATLTYTNNLTGDCEIFGVANLVSTTSGITTTNEWSFLHPCTNVLITHTQTVTGFIPANIMLSPDFTEICIGQTFDLSTINFFDFNNNVVSVSYHTAFPTSTFNEVTNPIVSPTILTTYIVSAKTAENCETVEPFTIFVVDGSDAGPDISDELCLDNTTTDLFSYLDASTVMDGFWLDIDGNGVDLSDANNVNLNTLSNGNYTFYYLTNAAGSCPSDTAELNLDIIGEIPYTVNDVACSADQMSYNVEIMVSDDILLSSSNGDVSNPANGIFSIENVAIAQSITIDLSSSLHSCTTSFIINPPNCNCPDIDPPTGDTEYTICQDELPLSLNVSVGAGLVANWYDSPSSLTPLASSTNNYTFTDDTPGLYSLYAEAEDPVSGCTSTDRLAIEIEVIALLTINDFMSEACDDDTDGLLSFDLDDLKTQLSNNPSFTFSIHPSSTDAMNNANELNGNYTTSTSSDTLYVVTTNANNCKGISLLILNVFQLPEVDVNTIAETCTNANNGIINFENISPTSYTLSFMGDDLGSETSLDSLSPGSYTYLLTDDNLCQLPGMITIEAASIISIEQADLMCNDASTETDPNDDFYTLDIQVDNSNAAATGYRLLQETVELGQFDYNQLTNLNLAADGNSYTLYIEDVDNLCLDSIVIGPLFPCSTNCELTVENLLNECQDNGTDQDPSDDFYTVSFSISAENGGANQKYQVLQNNIILGVFDYDFMVSIDLPATGNTSSLIIIDLDDNQCSTTIDLGTLDSCSGACSLSITIIDSVCDDNDTSEDINDDLYLISFTVAENNTNNTDYIVTIDGTEQGIYLYDVAYDIAIPADNMTHMIRAEDRLNDLCNDQVTSAILSSCSTPCTDEITANTSNEINCNETTSLLSAVASSTVSTYSWIYQGAEISNMPTVSVGNAGIYELIVTFENGCTDNDEVEVTKDDDIPTADAGPDVILNCDISIANLGGGMTTTGSQYTYAWTDENGMVVSTDINYMTSDTGRFFLQVTDSNTLCQSSIQEVNVTSNLEVPSVAIFANPGDILDCVIATIILSSENQPNVDYSWLLPEGGSSTNTEITITFPGTYTLIATNALSACVDTNSITIVDFEDYPNINLSSDGELDCDTDTVNLSASYDNSNANLILEWQDDMGNLIESNQDSLSVAAPGWYYVAITDQSNGCNTIDSIEVLENINEFGLDLAPSITVVSGISTELNLMINLPAVDIASIVWSPAEGLSCIDCTNPSVNITENSNYTVIVTDLAGCTSEASINILVEEIEKIYTPNVFNPNSQNQDNSRFTIFSSDTDAIITELKIYDRWGNNVYGINNIRANDTTEGWDGTFKGEPVVQGVYVYVATVLLSSGDAEVVSGDITVLLGQ